MKYKHHCFRLHNYEETFSAELKNVSVNFEIHEIVSSTDLELEFINPSNKAFEVIFSFNLDETSILNRFEAQLGSNKLISKVLEKNEAFGEYDDTISEGHGSYLIEKNGSSYKLMLGNFMGGQTFKCRMKVIKPLVQNFNQSTFSFPIHNFRAGNLLKINGSILSKSKIESIKSNISQYFSDKKRFSLECDSKNDSIPKSIIISIKYQKKTGPTLWIEQHSEDKNSFASLLQYTPRFDDLTIESNLEVVFVIDNSGSMCGQKYYEAIRLLKTFLNILPADAKFNIYGCHQNYIHTFDKSVEINYKNIKNALGKVSVWEIYDSSFTIIPVLKDIEKRKLDNSNLRVIIITDDGNNYKNNTLHIISNVSTIIFGSYVSHKIIEFYSNLTDYSHICFIDPLNINEEDVLNFFISSISKPGRINFSISNNELTTPQNITNILNGQTVNIFSLFNSEIDHESEMPKLDDMFIEVECNGIKKKDKISVKKFTSKLNALHVLATQNLCDEFSKLKRYDEEGNPIIDYKDIVVDLASRFQIISEYTSMVSLHEQEIAHQEQLKKVFIKSKPVKDIVDFTTPKIKRAYMKSKMKKDKRMIERPYFSSLSQFSLVVDLNDASEEEMSIHEFNIDISNRINYNQDYDAEEIYDIENIGFIDIIILMNEDGTWPLNFVSDFTKINQLNIIKSNPISNNITIDIDLDLCWGAFLVLESINEYLPKFLNFLLWRTFHLLDKLEKQNLNIKKLKKKASKFIKSNF